MHCVTKCGGRISCSQAWQQVRRNGGSAGVDGETFRDIEAHGINRWLGKLAGDLREGTYKPRAVRQVLIPKKQPGKFRPLGIPCICDRVVQTSAMLVLEAIFEADLQEEQYAYRKGRGAQEAVKRVHRLVNTGRREVVDADLSNYFGEIPHDKMMKSLARRISDGRMLELIKSWLVMPVAEDDGKAGKRLTNRARKEGKGTAARRANLSFAEQHRRSPIAYMRRFLIAWKLLGYARRFQASIVNYADDFVVLGKGRWYSDAGSGGDHNAASETPDQRKEDPMRPVPRRTVSVPWVPDWAQLPPGRQMFLYSACTKIL